MLGAGALGVYFGGRLIEAGHDVTFLVRGNRAERIHNNGLEIHSTRGNYVVAQPKVVVDVSEIDRVDLVFFSVKGYHLQGAIPTLIELAKKGAYILPVLNGVEHFSVIEKALRPFIEQGVTKEHPVLGGLSFIIATLDEKGYVHHTSKQHKLVYGAFHHSQQEFCNKLQTLLTKVNIESENSEDVLLALWEKYMFITAFSSVTTAANLPIGMIRKYAETKQVGIDVLQEMRQLGNKYNVPLDETHVEKAIALIDELPDEGTSSMHQDKRKGLPLELDHLQGAALRLAEKANITLPTISLVVRLTKPYEKGLPL